MKPKAFKARRRTWEIKPITKVKKSKKVYKRKENKKKIQESTNE